MLEIILFLGILFISSVHFLVKNIRTKSLIISLLNLLLGLFYYTIQNQFLALSTPEIFLLGFFIIYSSSGLILYFYSLIEQYFLNQSQTERKYLKDWYEIKITIDVVFIIALIVRAFIFQPFFISGSSMEPDFQDGNLIIVEKVSYYFRQPKRGEVIVFHPPEEPGKIYIKRIIGLPGETVEIKNGQVTIIDKTGRAMPLYEPYTNQIPTLGYQSVKLGPYEYYVLGDNREPNMSRDSREIGPIPSINIIGRAWFKFWPSWELIKTPQYGFSSSLFWPSIKGVS